MHTNFSDKILRLVSIFLFTIGMIWMPGENVNAQEPEPGPTIDARANDDQLEGRHWPLGQTVTIEIDDPATPEDPDYTGFATVGIADFDPELTWFRIDLDDYDLKVGDLVTATDGNTTKEHIVRNLEIFEADYQTDRIYGKAEPGQIVSVGTCWIDSCANRDETADQDGFWVADFTIPGEKDWEQDTADLRDGSWVDSLVSDEEGDSTKFGLHVQAPNPFIAVLLAQNAVADYGWPCGTPITLTIDDPTNGPGIDYTDTHPACEGDSLPFAYLGFWLGHDFQVRPGYLVSVTGGGLTQTHTVQNIRVTDINYEQDTVSGICTPGAQVKLNFHNSIYRSVFADDLGNWTADFSQPGNQPEEQILYDVTPVIEGPIYCFDNQPVDTDSTVFTYPVGFAVYPGGDIWGNNWWAGEEVMLIIEDPGTSESPDYMATAMPEPGPWVLSGVGFQLGGLFDVQPGHIVTLTQGEIVKSHVVSSAIAITGVDTETDMVRGRATPNAYVLVGVAPGDGGSRTVKANQDGNWMADFSVVKYPWEMVFDITTESSVWASENDNDSDATNVSWQWPWIEINLTDNLVQGLAWQLGATATLTIDDPTNGAGVDYTETQMVVSDNPWGGSESWVEFTPSFVIKRGDIVTLTDGQMTKSHIVEDVVITSIELASDSIYGTAGSDADITIWVWGCASRQFFADQDGNWIADFSVPGENEWEGVTCDIQPGTSGMVAQTINAGDWEYKFWNVPQNAPPLIELIEAPLEPVQMGQSIIATVTFDDPDPGDIHTVTWNWGDDSSTTLPATLPSASASHNYTSAGVYTVTVTITDADGKSDTKSFQYVVIYDPSGGFVTGGGWFIDPATGAKAHFGFNPKYHKDGTLKGETEFNLDGLKFKSATHDWLVINGAKAMFTGTGSVNGSSSYRFFVSVVDGDIAGGADRLRILIWDEATGELIYDNQPGASINADPETVIGGGSIVVHKAK